jgi:hypothetical protein
MQSMFFIKRREKGVTNLAAKLPQGYNKGKKKIQNTNSSKSERQKGEQTEGSPHVLSSRLTPRSQASARPV